MSNLRRETARPAAGRAIWEYSINVRLILERGHYFPDKCPSFTDGFRVGLVGSRVFEGLQGRFFQL